MAIGELRPQPRRRQRAKRLRELGYQDYDDYLRSPHWRAIKARYRASELPQVCMCGETEVHLHHKTYERIGAENLTDLTPLCATCHTLIHVLERRGEIGLDLAGFESAQRRVAYATQRAPMLTRAQADRDVADPTGWHALRADYEDALNRWVKAGGIDPDANTHVSAIRRCLDRIERKLAA